MDAAGSKVAQPRGLLPPSAVDVDRDRCAIVIDLVLGPSVAPAQLAGAEAAAVGDTAGVGSHHNALPAAERRESTRRRSASA